MYPPPRSAPQKSKKKKELHVRSSAADEVGDLNVKKKKLLKYTTAKTRQLNKNSRVTNLVFQGYNGSNSTKPVGH